MKSLRSPPSCSQEALHTKSPHVAWSALAPARVRNKLASDSMAGLTEPEQNAFLTVLRDRPSTLLRLISTTRAHLSVWLTCCQQWHVLAQCWGASNVVAGSLSASIGIDASC